MALLPTGSVPVSVSIDTSDVSLPPELRHAGRAWGDGVVDEAQQCRTGFVRGIRLAGSHRVEALGKPGRHERPGAVVIGGGRSEHGRTGRLGNGHRRSGVA